MVRLITLTRARRWLQLWDAVKTGWLERNPLLRESSWQHLSVCGQGLALLVTNGTFPGLRPALEFAHGHYHQDQVSLHAVRHERRKVRLREVLLLLPGANRHSPVQRRSLLLPALPASLRLRSLRLGGNAPPVPCPGHPRGPSHSFAPPCSSTEFPKYCPHSI